jgi:hypothetical protein
MVADYEHKALSEDGLIRALLVINYETKAASINDVKAAFIKTGFDRARTGEVTAGFRKFCLH